MNLDAINFSKKFGNELFIGNEYCQTLLDFWRWAYSDLIGNTERGTVAEFIVAMACKVDDSVRVSWDSYDLTLKNGIKVEVKSSAYLQTWKKSLNPLDVKQWEFYVIATETLNRKVQDSKTITLNKLLQIGAKSVTYENLHEIILMTF